MKAPAKSHGLPIIEIRNRVLEFGILGLVTDEDTDASGEQIKTIKQDNDVRI